MVNKRLARFRTDFKYAVHLVKKRTKPTILSIKSKISLIRLTVSSNLTIFEMKVTEARVNLRVAGIIRKRLKIIELQEKLRDLILIRADIMKDR